MTLDIRVEAEPRRGSPDKHWSFIPPKVPSLPQVKQADWPTTEVDRFVLAALEGKGLGPAAPADKLTLIRRATFDLTGLPPTPEEIVAFLEDASPAAYERLIDRLLASPHYGEKWGRHWLDVVRFGETQGFERNRIRNNAWRYRDWVIATLNRDLPYDEFVRLQIAGDVLYSNDLDALVATGYHVVGTWDQVAHLEGRPSMRELARQDALEDLVATAGQAYLGLTINCARCHDHKFDPVSRKEYYQVAALLGGVNQEEKERQVRGVSNDPQLAAAVASKLETARRELAALEGAVRKTHAGASGAAPDGVDGLRALYRVEDQNTASLSDASGVGAPLELRSGGVPRWSSAGPPKKLVQAAKASGEFTVEAWVTPAKARQAGPARVVTLSADASVRNFTLGHDGTRFEVRFRTSRTDGNGMPAVTSPEGVGKAERTHVVYTFARDGVGRLYVNGRPVAEKRVGGDLSTWDETLRLGLGDELNGQRKWEGEFHFVALYSQALSDSQVTRHFQTQSRDVRAAPSMEELFAMATAQERERHAKLLQERKRLEGELAELTYSGPLHVIVPKQPPVFHDLDRGNLNTPGDIVSPAGIQALSLGGLPSDFGLAPDAPEAQRRVKLAGWLTDPRNPLTARVFVNRLWHYHFGQGIVDTPGDFGTQGGRPSHPELLDYLALRFVRGGWKVKDMHRLLMTSAAYRQESRVRNPEAESIDADNRLLWRFNRRRLDGEAVRDAALAASGALNRRVGGPSFRDLKVDQSDPTDGFGEPTNEFTDETCRRTIYRLWSRNGGNPLLEALDCPDPSVMTPRRTLSITPVQSLSLMNSAFMERCAARFSRRIREDAAGGDVARQIDRTYRLALGRPPTGEELSLAVPFVQRRGLQQFCLVLYNANEFLFVN